MGAPQLRPELIPVLVEGGRTKGKDSAGGEDLVSGPAADEAFDNENAVMQDQESIIDEPVMVQGKEYKMTCVSMGNPHAVIFMDDVTHLDLEKIGPHFENHERFPKRINTEFVKVLDRQTVQMRVWERGTGETLACGTGCCATVVACILNGLTDNTVTVKLLGGEIEITWDREADLVYMTGPAAAVFEGEWQA